MAADGQHPTGMISLYAALQGRKIAAKLNKEKKRPSERESLLELLLVALSMEGSNGDLRFPAPLLWQADLIRRQGGRLVNRFDEVTGEHVVHLDRPTPEGQQTLDGA